MAFAVRRRAPVERPPRSPATRASAEVHWCPVPFACDALPPRAASRRCVSAGIAAKPRRGFFRGAPVVGAVGVLGVAWVWSSMGLLGRPERALVVARGASLAS